MAYEPTTWAGGDTVTAAKLNKLEQGVAEAASTGGGLLVTLRINNDETNGEESESGTESEVAHGGVVEVSATPVYTDKTAREIIETLESGGNVVLKVITITDGVEFTDYLVLLHVAISDDGHCSFSFGDSRTPYTCMNLVADSLDGFLYQSGGTSGAIILDPSTGSASEGGRA